MIDLSAVKNMTPTAVAAPARRVSEVKPLEAKLPELPASPPASEISTLPEGFRDFVIECPDDDVITSVSDTFGASSQANRVDDSEKVADVAQAVTSATTSSIGRDAFSSDFVIEPPEEDVPLVAVAEPELHLLPLALEEDPEPCIVHSDLGVQAPADVLSLEPSIPMKQEIDEEEEWELNEIPDINKLHLATKESKPAETSNVPDFIFPTSKTSDGDVKRNKKASKRDKYASADAASESSNIMDAYTSSTQAPAPPPVRASPGTVRASPAPATAARTTASSPATVNISAGKPPIASTSASTKQVSKVAHKVPVKSITLKPAAAPAKATADPMPTEQAPVVKVERNPLPAPDTEKKHSALYVPPALASLSAESSSGNTTRRSLRPGGGKTQEVLNVPSAHANKPRISYSKKELKSLLPNPLCDRPPVLAAYNVITIVEGNSARQVKSICMGGTPPTHSEKLSAGGRSSTPSSFSSDKWAKQAPPGLSAEERATGLAGFAQPPQNISSPQYRHGGGSRSKRNIPMPMPKKQYDQVEKYSRDVQGILNKISPGNFQKLIVELCNIPCVDAVMMEKLITLIFEKALQEPTFSKMYADMCFYIEHRSPHILCNFFYVVHFESTLQYKWLRDVKLSTDFTGPFNSEAECLLAMDAVALPQMNHVLAGPLVHVSLIVRGDYLVQIAKIVDRESYYTNRLPVSDVDPANFSDRLFANPEAATKDYIKKNGFRRNLVTTCQNEFIASVNKENRYYDISEKVEAFEANSSNMTEEQKQQEALEIEELTSKMKRRMLGNIRFIGELFKSNMLREANIFDCIEVLMVNFDGNTGEKSWKTMDERSIEILSKLVTTVGEDIRRQDSLDDFFERMYDLSVDKSLNSRMRFMLKEVLELRANNWAGREVRSEKNAYVGGFIPSIIPAESPVIRHINNMPVGLATSAQLNRTNRSNSGSAGNSPMDTRIASSTQASAIAPTLFSSSPSSNTPLRQGSPSIPLAPAVASPGTSIRGSPSMTGGKTRRPSGGGSFDASTWRSPSPSAASPTVVAHDYISTPVASKRKINIDGALDDYFSLDPESADAESCIDDMRQCSVTSVVSKLIERALEARPAKLPGIVRLTELLTTHFSSCRVDVEAAIASAESLQLLGDMILDYKEVNLPFAKIICSFELILLLMQL